MPLIRDTLALGDQEVRHQFRTELTHFVLSNQSLGGDF